MFNINDNVMYGHSEVCVVNDIIKKKVKEEDKLFYALKPMYDNKMIIYSPVDNEKIKIRKILSSDELLYITNNMNTSEVFDWIENDQVRKATLSDILKTADTNKLIIILRTLLKNKTKILSVGKKFHISDETVLNETQRLLYQEFATSFNITPEDIISCVTGQLKLSKELLK